MIAALLFSSCRKEEENQYLQKRINLSKHTIETYSINSYLEILIVFKTGLVDDHSIWTMKNIQIQISNRADVIFYDRAGYGKSEAGPNPRNISKLTSELDSIL